MIPVRDSLALVLAGGEGRRLSPLTHERSKPAVYFGGRYRLIDFVLSNLVNSGFQHIKVLTQYRATSLIRHLSRAWSLGGVLDASIEPVPAGQNIGPFWFRGTADAIWQNLDLLREMRPARRRDLRLRPRLQDGRLAHARARTARATRT